MTLKLNEPRWPVNISLEAVAETDHNFSRIVIRRPSTTTQNPPLHAPSYFLTFSSTALCLVSFQWT